MPRCKLSRFPLVGTITDATPTCVILELAASHGCRIVQTSNTNDPILQIIPIIRHTTTLEVIIDENASSKSNCERFEGLMFGRVFDLESEDPEIRYFLCIDILSTINSEDLLSVRHIATSISLFKGNV
jgi:hypothetical protein